LTGTELKLFLTLRKKAFVELLHRCIEKAMHLEVNHDSMYGLHHSAQLKWCLPKPRESIQNQHTTISLDLAKNVKPFIGKQKNDANVIANASP
jgi:hypothetical protein